MEVLFLEHLQVVRIIKNLKFFLIPVIIAGLGYVYYNFSPAEDSFFLKCPFKMMTGLECPGCGSQRAVHELLHLNIGKAFQYNPLMVSAIPYLALGFLFNIEGVKTRFPKTRKFFFGTRTIYLILLIILIFFIFRNL